MASLELDGGEEWSGEFVIGQQSRSEEEDQLESGGRMGVKLS